MYQTSNTLTLVSMEDTVKLSSRMSNCLPYLDVCVWSRIVMQKEEIIDWQDLALTDYDIFGPIKKGLRSKQYGSKKKWKKNSGEEVQWTVYRILRRSNTSSHSKGEYWYWEKPWLFWEVGI